MTNPSLHDIEDNGAGLEIDEDYDRGAPRKAGVVRKGVKKQEAEVSPAQLNEINKNNCEVICNAPGIGKVYVKTWGCAHNNSDSEYMAGLVSEYGYEITENKLEADLWLLNSCTVKSPAEMHFRVIVI